MRRITRDELKDRLESGHPITLIEALPEKYWQTAHLPGALQMDYTEVRDRAHSVLPDKDAEIVVYCASRECQNSSKAASMLESLGYSEVYEYEEGKEHWMQAGLPVESEEG